MDIKDTIIALATPAGVGAISVIRISGENVIDIASSLFISVKGKNLKKQSTHTAHLGHILDGDRIIDQVLVTIFKSPHSYTGESVVEISCHGSSFIQQEIIQLFLKNGCRMADNGEFTMRAFLNGKMDLSQAEAVADVIASNSAASHQVAISQMRGGIANELKLLREKLLNFASLIELELDFSGEDVEFADRTQFKQLLSKIKTVIKQLIDSFAFGNAMKNGVPVAIIGEPNVGKSTLLNALLKEDKAIVSEIAGTTRDAIEDDIIIDGVLFRFIDTAGLRETQDVIESIGIQRSYEKAEKAQLVIYLVDSSKIETTELLKNIEKIKNRFKQKRVLAIANKVDLINDSKIAELKSKIPNLLLLSAKQETGIDKLLHELTSLVNIGALSNNETIVTNSRHFEELNHSLKSITAVQEGIEQNIPSDLIAIDIRECLSHLGNITG